MKAAYEKAVGHAVPKSTVYRLLSRHGWRKSGASRRHPQAEPTAQEQFEKTSRASSGKK